MGVTVLSITSDVRLYTAVMFVPPLTDAVLRARSSASTDDRPARSAISSVPYASSPVAAHHSRRVQVVAAECVSHSSVSLSLTSLSWSWSWRAARCKLSMIMDLRETTRTDLQLYTTECTARLVAPTKQGGGGCGVRCA